MNTKRLFCMLLFVCLVPLSILADGDWEDPVSKLKYRYHDLGSSTATASVIGCNKDNVDIIVIPSTITIFGYDLTVNYINSGAFKDCTSLNSVTMPSSMKLIGDHAFSGCTSLTDITIPSSVTEIGRYAFSGCTSLTDITIPSSVYYMGRSAFEGCNSLSSLTIQESVGIGYRAFFGCTSLTELSIPRGVGVEAEAFGGCTSLTRVIVNADNFGENTLGTIFEGCLNLTSVVFGKDVVSIGEDALKDCISLTSVTIPDGVASIGNFAFFGCTNLTKITIPSSVSDMGVGAFGNCTGLTTLIIQEGVTSIGDLGFEGCSGLTSIIIPNSVTSIGNGAFYNCSGLTSVTIPNSVTSLDGAFFGCSSLTSVTIPNSVTSIGREAFYGCSCLTTITIPNSVTSIEEDAFADCTGLKEVQSMIKEPFAIEYNVFQILNRETKKYEFTTATLYVPAGTKDKYTATNGWKNFTNIVEMIGLEPVNDDDNVDYGEDNGIDENTKLDRRVIQTIFYSIGTDAGSYNKSEGCIEVKKSVGDDDMDAIAGKELSDDALKGFTGLIFKVNTGKGTVTVNGETTGGMTLKVKIGNAQPMAKALDGKQKATFQYNVSEPTYVYIYAGNSGAASVRGVAEEPSLKIYGIEWKQDAGTPTDIDSLTPYPSPKGEGSVYTLGGQRIDAQPKKKGVYIRGGKKFVR